MNLVRLLALFFSVSESMLGLEGLAASGPLPKLADKLMLYGQFVGDWDFEWVGVGPDGSKQTGKGEWLFRWTLEGRAIQDVWIMPPRSERAKPDAPLGEYGTTVRFYDPAIDAWRVGWNGPINGNARTFTTRKVGNEIVQEGTSPEGFPIRWTFSKITPRSFRWRGVISKDGGKTWQFQQEMNAHRRGSNPTPPSPSVSSHGLPGLDAPGPSPQIANELMLYGQFVGDWDFEWTGIDSDGSKQTGQGEWLFGWVLEGRAVQDVWIFPPRAERAKPNHPAGEYGTTLRFFDPKIQAWRVTWNAPEQGLLLTFTAKKVGNEIVQEGKTLKGLPMRWTFSNITPNSFHWRSVVSADGGTTWQLREEMNVRRHGAVSATSTPQREAAMSVQSAAGSEAAEPGRRHADVATEDAGQMAVTRETEIEGQLR